MASASIYAAARMENTPRTLERITQVSRVERKEIGRTYWYINKETNLKIEPADPMEFLSRFASNLDADNETERIAREWIMKGKEVNITSGRAPSGIAAVALFAARQLSGEDLSQKEIAEVADVTNVTVRDRLNDLVEHADFSWI